MQYEAVIGLEVHAQLKTKSKIFCFCSTQFGSKPNQNTCPICLGMPGVLPILNREVVAFTIKMGLATNCSIASFCRFARKNYFYPDLPKGYQISQFELPLCQKGNVTINLNENTKKIGITRIHMEEDAGKLIHGENLGQPDSSYVDFNRTSLPLIEIVSEPDIRSSEEAREYLLKLKATLEYLNICDCNMEEGSLRCDANISLRPEGEEKLGTKTELKNMNSFRNVQRAIEYEIKRQTHILDNDEKVIQQTRLWDTGKNETILMRTKEEAHDYRYFPDPDLVPIVVNDEWIEKIRKDLPELPDEKRKRFVKQYRIPEYDAGVLTSSRPLADYYEQCVEMFPQPKTTSNWIMGDILRALKTDDKEIMDCPVTPKHLTDMLKMIDDKTISSKIAKTVFEEMYSSGIPPVEIVKKKGLVQISDEDSILRIIQDILNKNKAEVEAYQNGKTKLLGFFVGQVMKATQGKANPALVNTLLKKNL
ncbi:MAG TPA: Asp-tRNA(Asn)/Glu-tRNA(Gln) amidotransferase subunit GatB [Nitrospinota bacterium]|jgi:aspartyl-tRNA(Asn)/glutamyl-tRNA(Gln) amidotransferase subunit B|nr:Asp-tRNA(Asn)/Glu-tRNA(Gln) amidotransferase subunit GatB [Nitrospinota bacterium]HJN02452.1 Asp-tRNA(Asn)/Glu-tRNA(Gln) amidotransferase subunit GatB [Nitrospinota bacterium]